MICYSAECGDLNNPDHGCVIKTGNTVGETAFYICDEGFTLNGERKRECEADGTWSGTKSTCESKCQSFYYTLFSNTSYSTQIRALPVCTVCQNN